MNRRRADVSSAFASRQTDQAESGRDARAPLFASSSRLRGSRREPLWGILTPLVAVCISASAWGAALDEIDVNRIRDPLGFRAAIPVNISGFTGEADAVLRQDLLFMGFKAVSLEEAKFLISGRNSGRIEGRLVERINQHTLLAKAYTGGNQRAQVHALADDIARAIVPAEPPIAQTRIAFKVETTRTTSEAYIADYDAFNAQAVTRDSAIIAAPSWGGKSSLIYATYKLGTPQIFLHQLSTGARIPVARYPGGNFSPAVSPNGRRVAMILSKNGSPDLYVANLDGGGLKQLTFTKQPDSSPCWSPDNETICFSSRQGGPSMLYTVAASGGQPKRLPTAGAPNATEPDWSPDGKWIAFTSLTGGFSICMVRPDGRDAMVLASGEDPSWAPNSRALIYCHGPDHAKRLSLLDVPSRTIKDVGRILGSNSQPSWAR